MAERAENTYQVFARKYRPGTFSSLIGQDSLVKIMRNAFAENRIAHAFILTGVRGVGKTTTARIIAKGLNCVGPDGAGEQTTEPCGVCDHCREIELGRHVDVLEMDAASRTGVNDIRDIIDSVGFRPVSCRYKIYIIDEVHMLSTNAFNALLKTLEEPPEHVKFIFATTEIRMVPVTVLSRCQRFDLRRVDPALMTSHLLDVARKEGAEIAEDALALIVRASEGSVRDALSLLDQSIALGRGEIAAEDVRSMLGIADKGRVLDLFELVMRGKTAESLEELRRQFNGGIEPESILSGLAEVIHWISVLKVSPRVAEDPSVSPDQKRRGGEMADALSMRSLSRAWQMALKAIDEVAYAPDSRTAVEMAIIRLCYVAELPAPEVLVRQLTEMGGRSHAPQPPTAPAGAGSVAAAPGASRPDPASGTASPGQGGLATQPAADPTEQPGGAELADVPADPAGTDLERFVHDHVLTKSVLEQFPNAKVRLVS